MPDATGSLEAPSLAIPRPAFTRPTFIVGIGASAGGLESLENLFRNLPADTGMAFVVLQHLSPDFKSMMYELLGRDTNMAIHRAEEGMQVVANSVYLLPPKKEMIIVEGRLHLSDKDPQKGLALPIDRFLESLARESGKRSIAIILSGSGSDGSRGVAEVAREGGYVIIESLETAKFDGMPSSALASGVVDEVLAPEEIGRSLVRLATEPEITRQQRVAIDAQRHDALRGMDAIYHLFRTAHDVDFSVYKDTTVLRRVHRRLAMIGVDNLDDYGQRLQEDSNELDALYSDLLIGVTQFFRDPETFSLLEQTVIPELIFAKEEGEPLRAWISGCATGEEAYSMAIIFHEAFQRAGKSFNLKLFATDVHKASLEVAGRGLYSGDVLKGVSPARREKYFELREGKYQVSQAIRKTIVFAPHNVLNDAPFTDLDFVSCRNMLIYFRPAAQRRALSMFHYALNRNGVLLLGGSESPGELSSEFEAVHERARIFRKLRDVRLPNEFRNPLNRQNQLALHASPVRSSVGVVAVGRESLNELLLNRFMPPSLLIDHGRALIDSFGGAEKLLQLRSRQPSLDILDLVDEGLRTTLAGAIQQVQKSNAPVRFTNLVVRRQGEEQAYHLTVSPLSSLSGKFMVLTFDPSELPTPRANVESQPAPGEMDASRDHIRRLEDDLRYSRENLQATIEELETSNEELQATNEELIASNEELQSTNEELHSVNEELYTVNAEHQRKISELAELNQDMAHLLENTDVATVFLDRQLRIRRFTSRVAIVFDLVEQDIGRPIDSFKAKFHIAQLHQRLQQVLDDGQPFECEIFSQGGACYLLRLLPYRTEDKVNGVVLMMVDVSSLEVLRDRLRWMSAIVESTDDAIIGQDLDGTITSWNQGATELYGYTAEEAIGQKVSMLIPEMNHNEVSEYRSNIDRGERLNAADTIRIRKNGTPVHVSLTVSPVRDSLNQTIGISKIARDISQRIKMEQEIRQQVRERETFLATLSHELRNPLGAILNASRLVRDERTPLATRENAAEIIERQVAMTRTLLADLLDVSRIAEGKLDLKLEPIDLRALVDTVRETTQSEMTRHECALVYELGEEPLPLLGDATRLVQVQVNLIHNAAKYSPQGAPVTVKLSRDRDWAIIEVIDQGIGIPENQLENIFKPFVQIVESRLQRDGGLGVGLTLVKTLVEKHGGEVTAHSAASGTGSIFRVRLPLIPFAELEQFYQQQAQTAEPAPSPPVKPRRIVVVEDLDDSRQMLCSLLELDGHTVFAAADGESGFELIVRKLPDVALVDIGLPGKDGHEVARSVRESPEACCTTLVALTGYGQQSDIDKALSSGFDSHLTKPIHPDRLSELLSQLPLQAPKHATLT